MPTGNPVTDEMVAKWKDKFSLITQNLNEHPCIGTLIHAWVEFLKSQENAKFKLIQVS